MKIFLIGGIVGIVIGFFIGVAYIGIVIVNSEEITISSLNNMNNEKLSYDFQKLYDIMKKNANQSYIGNATYDCSNFSNDLIANLTELGFNAKCAFGYSISYEENKTIKNPHDWVLVIIPIEATSGIFISPERYNKYYELEVVREKCR